MIGGDAALVRVAGSGISALARGISTWTYNASVPSLGVVKTTQYSYYFHSTKEETDFMIGARHFGEVSTPEALASMGFNMLVEDASKITSVLNEAMLSGIFVLADAGDGTMWSPKSIEAALDGALCHPNFAGAFQAVSNTTFVPQVKPAAEKFRNRAPGSFSRSPQRLAIKTFRRQLPLPACPWSWFQSRPRNEEHLTE